MKNKQDQQVWVERAMNSLEGIAAVEANPFLYPKIQNRMAVNDHTNTYGTWMYGLAIMLLMLVFVNVYSYSSFLQNGKNVPASGIESFANDYSLKTTAENI